MSYPVKLFILDNDTAAALPYLYSWNVFRITNAPPESTGAGIRQLAARVLPNMPFQVLRRLSLVSNLRRCNTRARTTSSDAIQTRSSFEEPELPLLRFVEEPLGLPAEEDFGYFQGRTGDGLSPGNRFKLRAKLGFGTTSSVGLAHDHRWD